MVAEEYISLDIGSKNIGIARGNSIAKIAEPINVVNANKIYEELEMIIKNYKPAGIVVGLPRNLNGDDTQQTKIVREWVDDAKKKIKLPFYWQDEALSTQTVLDKFAKSKVNHAMNVDDLAAAVILQDFLDSPETERSIC